MVEMETCTRESTNGASAGADPGSACGRTVLVVDRHALVAQGLALALAQCGWTAEASSGPTAGDVVELVHRTQPACVLMDLRHGNGLGNGIELIAPIAASGALVVMLTAERRRLVLAECLEAGAAGWISKDSDLDEVDQMLRRVAAGDNILGKTDRVAMLAALRLARDSQHAAQEVFDRLTEREALVLAALVDGLGAEGIAKEHFVAVTTVRSQIRAVLQKLGVRSQLAAVSLAVGYRDLLPEREGTDRDRRRPNVTRWRPTPELAPRIA